MPRWLGIALVVTALVGIPAVAGLVASSRPPPAPHRARARVQVSGAPLIGYGAPAKT